jgi:hypothetical protein
VEVAATAAIAMAATAVAAVKAAMAVVAMAVTAAVAGAAATAVVVAAVDTAVAVVAAVAIAAAVAISPNINPDKAAIAISRNFFYNRLQKHNFFRDLLFVLVVSCR